MRNISLYIIFLLASPLAIAQPNRPTPAATTTIPKVQQENEANRVPAPPDTGPETNVRYGTLRSYPSKQNNLNCELRSKESLIEELAQRSDLRQSLTKKTSVERHSSIEYLKKSNNFAYRTAVSHLIERSISSEDTDQGFLTWFWINHFSVFFAKGDVSIALCDYIKTIHEHSEGQFSDLLRVVITHPAMLIYLDNNANTAKKTNENFAREILELYTLGVNGGYTQEDVQEFARVLTGYQIPKYKNEVNAYNSANIPPNLSFVRSNHDIGNKKVLGREIKGSANGELNTVISILATHPSTARHIATRLSTYLVSDDPDPDLIEKAAEIFKASNGNIRNTVAFIKEEKQTHNIRNQKYKSPYQYIITSMRLITPPKSLHTTRVAARLIETLGEPIFSRRTPDGYPLKTDTWITPAQITSRLVAAREITRLKHELEDQKTTNSGQESAPTNITSNATFKQLASPDFMFH